MVVRKLVDHSIAVLACLFVFGVAPSVAMAAPQKDNPDFTRGGQIPTGAKHNWTLGATGARGWIYCDRLVTSDARQIAITEVAEDSPAEGFLAVGDIILGVRGKPFAHDPRTNWAERSPLLNRGPGTRQAATCGTAGCGACGGCGARIQARAGGSPAGLTARALSGTPDRPDPAPCGRSSPERSNGSSVSAR